MSQFTLDDLAAIINERSSASAASSYTKSLLDSGIERVAKKFGEEAVETVIASMAGDKDALVNETADVLYHLLVLLRCCDIPLDAVMTELGQRTRQSGHAEKSGRQEKN